MTAAGRVVVYGFAVALLVAVAVQVARGLETQPLGQVLRDLAGGWFLAVFIAGLVLFAFAGRVKVYEVAVEGAKEALEVAARIVPFLVMILVAIAMFRASGAMDLLLGVLDPVTSAVGIPAEALPMAILRPMSGSGAYGIMVEIMETHGPDSFVGLYVSSLMGSTETTFYVLTIYFGAARIREGRHALASCLSGDLAGVLMAALACHWLFG